MIFVLLWLTALATSVVFLLATVVAARALAVPMRAARVFLGPPIARATIASVPFELGAIPLPLAYVSFVRESDESDERASDDIFPAMLSRPKRAALLLLPWGAVALVCAAVLGPVPAIESIGRGFAQILGGTLSPGVVGRGLIATLVSLATTEPWPMAGARLATKLIAFNLLPLPGLAGWSLIEVVTPRLPLRLRAGLAAAGRLVTLAVALAWLWAVIAYL